MIQERPISILFYYKHVWLSKCFGEQKHQVFQDDNFNTYIFNKLWKRKFESWYTYRPHNQIKYRFTNFYFMLKLQPGWLPTPRPPNVHLKTLLPKNPSLASHYPSMTSQNLNMTQQSHAIWLLSQELSAAMLPLALFFTFPSFILGSSYDLPSKTLLLQLSIPILLPQQTTPYPSWLRWNTVRQQKSFQTFQTYIFIAFWIHHAH